MFFSFSRGCGIEFPVKHPLVTDSNSPKALENGTATVCTERQQNGISSHSPQLTRANGHQNAVQCEYFFVITSFKAIRTCEFLILMCLTLTL